MLVSTFSSHFNHFKKTIEVIIIKITYKYVLKSYLSESRKHPKVQLIAFNTDFNTSLMHL